MLLIQNNSAARFWFAVGSLSAIIYGVALQSPFLNLVLHMLMCWVFFTNVVTIQFEVHKLVVPDTVPVSGPVVGEAPKVAPDSEVPPPEPSPATYEQPSDSSASASEEAKI